MPWREEPGRPPSAGSQRVRHDGGDSARVHWLNREAAGSSTRQARSEGGTGRQGARAWGALSLAVRLSTDALTGMSGSIKTTGLKVDHHPPDSFYPKQMLFIDGASA